MMSAIILWLVINFQDRRNIMVVNLRKLLLDEIENILVWTVEDYPLGTVSIARTTKMKNYLKRFILSRALNIFNLYETNSDNIVAMVPNPVLSVVVLNNIIQIIYL